MEDDLYLLLQFGSFLDRRLPQIDGRSLRDLLIAELLKIRVKEGGIESLELNRPQLEYSRRCTKQNIVLKARQVGITTYIAARFFVQTITRPGTADGAGSPQPGIGRIDFRYRAALLGKTARRAAQRRADAFARQCPPNRVSAARQRIPSGNGGRERGAGDDYPLPALLGGLPLAPRCGGNDGFFAGGGGAWGRDRAGIHAERDAGVFYEEWQKANETGYTQHFFPWWYEENYRGICNRGEILVLTAEEKELVEQHGLEREQIAWRRRQWATLRNLAGQEYAEDPSSCFLASGECVFDLEAIGTAAASAAPALDRRITNGWWSGFRTRKGGATSLGWTPREEGRRGITRLPR